MSKTNMTSDEWRGVHKFKCSCQCGVIHLVMVHMSKTLHTEFESQEEEGGGRGGDGGRRRIRPGEEGYNRKKPSGA